MVGDCFKIQKLTTLMKHLGGLNLAWWLNEMWTATQEQRDL
jgi:hypothetical protein